MLPPTLMLCSQCSCVLFGCKKLKDKSKEKSKGTTQPVAETKQRELLRGGVSGGYQYAVRARACPGCRQTDQQHLSLHQLARI